LNSIAKETDKAQIKKIQLRKKILFLLDFDFNLLKNTLNSKFPFISKEFIVVNFFLIFFCGRQGAVSVKMAVLFNG